MTTVEFASGAGNLGLAGDAVRELVTLRRAGECARVQTRMAELVADRLTEVQTQLAGVLAEQAAAGGLGTQAPAEPLAGSIPMFKTAGRLQTAARMLAEPARAGACGEECACSRAASVTFGAFVLPTLDGSAVAATPDGLPIVCTLDADGGDLDGRVAEWHAVLAQATSRQAIPDGVAATFTHDIARTADLARLLAAEYSCCSFASYHLSVDAHGVRIEIHTPEEGRDALVSMFGTTHQP